MSKREMESPYPLTGKCYSSMYHTVTNDGRYCCGNIPMDFY